MKYLFILIGPFMIVMSIVTFIKRRSFFKASTVVNGTVIEIKTRPAKNNQTVYYPVVRYHDSITQSEEEFESSNPYDSSKFKIGDQVEIRYLKDGLKKKACLNNWSGIWGFCSMLLLFGIIFSVIDFFLFLL